MSVTKLIYGRDRSRKICLRVRECERNWRVTTDPTHATLRRCSLSDSVPDSFITVVRAVD